MMVEITVNFSKKEFEMQSLMSLMSYILTYWTNESLVFTVGINTNKVQNFSFMKFSLIAF
jgi:hypothetical protein